MINFILHPRTPGQSFFTAFTYISDYFSIQPLSPFLPCGLILGILVGSAWLLKRKNDPFQIILFWSCFAVLVLSFFGALSIQRTPYPYIMRHLIVLPSLFIYLISSSLLIRTKQRFSSPHWHRVLSILLALTILLLPGWKFKTPLLRQDSDSVLTHLHPQKETAYEVFLTRGSPHHGQWSEAIKIALRLWLLFQESDPPALSHPYKMKTSNNQE